MFNHWMCVQSIFIVLLSSYRASSSSFNLELPSVNRVRRILFGKELYDYNSGYSVTYYHVWISNQHLCGYRTSFVNFLKSVGRLVTSNDGIYKNCDVFVKNEMCGGSLLTPRIVQTACHCLANKNNDAGKTNWNYYKVNNALEDQLVSYVGSTHIDDMKVGYLSKSFIIHQKCAHYGTNGKISYDIGVILLEATVKADPWNFAPVPTEQDMLYMWNLLSFQEAVCLFVGFGVFMDFRLPSPVLRHYWGIVRNYQTCYEWTNHFTAPNFNYTLNSTWFCSTALPGKKTLAHQGDSGSPVTCDNTPVGLVSTITSGHLIYAARYDDNLIISKPLNLHTALIYATWENAAEHRNAFIKEMEEMEKRKDEEEGRKYV
uniref:Peptidase S1 domain-containing protein n=2 Tax=Lygus hesperus TaxID=30085 RepID=A0A0A9Z5M5_LYGHE